MSTTSEHTKTFLVALALLASTLALPRLCRADDAGLNQPCTFPGSTQYALVIGNSSYKGDNVSGRQDALAMRDALCQLHFNVLQPVIDGSFTDMHDALTDFGGQISDASTVLFFYSGHGFQLDSGNYLLPVGGSATEGGSISVDNEVAQVMGKASHAVKLIILDACRNDISLPEDAKPGFKPPVPPPAGLLYAFAAGFDQVAASGKSTDISPYTEALLHDILEPGLEIRQLLRRVHARVLLNSDPPQEPAEVGIDHLPREFYLSPPAFVCAKIEQADDDLIVFLNGEMVLDWSSDQSKLTRLRLRAGKNHLVLMLYNANSFHNSQSWERTEGWYYSFKLHLKDGTELRCPEQGADANCFDGHEEIPFKSGPRHGKLFTVATADLTVDRRSAEVTIQAQKNVWSTAAPTWANDQDLLFQESIKDLKLQSDIVPALARQLAASLGQGDPNSLLQRLVQQALIGLLNSNGIIDWGQIFVVARGNRADRDVVQFCMSDKLPDRLAALQASLKAAIQPQVPTPFAQFDDNLTQCVKGEAANRQLPGAGEMKVWTAVEDRRRDHGVPPPGPSAPSIELCPDAMPATSMH